MARYYNTSKAQVGAIKELISMSNVYDAFKIEFESPISNLFGLNVKQL